MRRNVTVLLGIGIVLGVLGVRQYLGSRNIVKSSSENDSEFKAIAISEGEDKKDENVINDGFVVVDGKYIDSPYIVTSEKGWLLVNNVRVRKMADWPIVIESDQKPQIPDDVLKIAQSFDDLIIGDGRDSWHGRMVRWINRTFPGNADRRNELIKFYESLPFVEKVVYPESAFMTVTLQDGQVREIGFEGSVPPAKEDILDGIEYTKRSLEERLSKGDVYLFFSNGLELSFGHVKSAEDLNLMVEVLQSERTAEDKADILRRMAILPEIDVDQVSSLVSGFQGSADLLKRIQNQMERTGIQPRTLDDLPDGSPQELERRIIEKELEHALEK